MDITKTHDWILKNLQISFNNNEIKLSLINQESKEVWFTITAFINYCGGNEAPWGKNNSINEIVKVNNKIKSIIIELQSGDNIKIDYLGEILETL